MDCTALEGMAMYGEVPMVSSGKSWKSYDRAASDLWSCPGREAWSLEKVLMIEGLGARCGSGDDREAM